MYIEHVYVSMKTHVCCWRGKAESIHAIGSRGVYCTRVDVYCTRADVSMMHVARDPHAVILLQDYRAFVSEFVGSVRSLNALIGHSSLSQM